MIAIQRV